MSISQFGSDDFQNAVRHSWRHAEPRKKEFVKIGRVKDINVPKIMKIRGPDMVESLETMKELVFLINSFLRGLAGLHECLSVI